MKRNNINRDVVNSRGTVVNAAPQFIGNVDTRSSRESSHRSISDCAAPPVYQFIDQIYRMNNR